MIEPNSNSVEVIVPTQPAVLQEDLPTVPLCLDIVFSDGQVFWKVYEMNEAAAAVGICDNDHVRLLVHGSCPIPMLDLNEQGLPGVKGSVLPPGRLHALMKAVETSEQMGKLCWEVLRAYSRYYGRHANPRHTVRQRAWQVLRPAMAAAGLTGHLGTHLPLDWWSGSLPPVPSGEPSLWPVSEEVHLGLGTSFISVRSQEPLEDLLDKTRHH